MLTLLGGDGQAKRLKRLKRLRGHVGLCYRLGAFLFLFLVSAQPYPHQPLISNDRNTYVTLHEIPIIYIYIYISIALDLCSQLGIELLPVQILAMNS